MCVCVFLIHIQVLASRPDCDCNFSRVRPVSDLAAATQASCVSSQAAHPTPLNGSAPKQQRCFDLAGWQALTQPHFFMR